MASENGYNALVYAAKRERLVIPDDPIPQPTQVDRRTLSTHYISKVIMEQHNLSERGIPKETTADGNCLFHAISLALYGSEQYSTEIRLRTCLQMCLHPQVYRNRADANDIFILSPSFEDSAIDCSKQTAYSSIWTLIAATDALGISISLTYPPVNGSQDLAFKVLNKLFDASTVWQPSTNINIMWTHTAVTSNPEGIWTPNHFVPVFKASSSDISFTPQSHSSPLPKPSHHQLSSPNNSVNLSYDLQESSTNINLNSSSPLPKISVQQCSFNQDSVTEQPDEQEDNVDQTYQPEMQSYNTSDESNTDDHGDEIKDDNAFPPPANVNYITNGHFMSAGAAWNIIQQKVNVFEDAPAGNKSNVWFLVDNTNNMKRRNEKKNSQYYDDCGVWESSKGKVYHQDYLLTENFRVVFRRDNQWCLKVRQSGKTRPTWWQIWFGEPKPRRKKIDFIVISYITAKRGQLQMLLLQQMDYIVFQTRRKKLQGNQVKSGGPAVKRQNKRQ